VVELRSPGKRTVPGGAECLAVLALRE